MKSVKINRYSSVMFLLLTILAVAALCSAENTADKTSIQDVQQETEELLEALKTYTAEQREEAIRKTSAALDHLDTRIDTLETEIDNRWDTMDKAVRAKARSSLKTLRTQRNQVAEWYGSLKNSSSEAWGHMKKGFSEAYKALSDAWENAEKEFGAGDA